MRAQFCVYACVLLLAGAHGCTGWFADKVKLTSFLHYECSQRRKFLATYNPTQLQPIIGRPFLVSPCVIPCYKIIPIKNSVRAQDGNFSGFNRFLEKVINTLFRIHIWLINLKGSAKASHLYIRGMIPKSPQKSFEYMLEMSLNKNHPLISFIL